MNKDEILLDIAEKIYAKVEAQGVDIQDIKVEQVRQAGQHDKNTADFAHHIHRTDLLEEDLNLAKAAIVSMEKRFTYLDGVLKFLGWLSGGLLVAQALIKIVSFLFHLKG